MGGNDFALWLQGQLDERGWNQARLAKKSGVSPGQIARIMSGSRDAGPEVARAMARALDLPEELVFRQAGLLSPEADKDKPPNLAEWIHLFQKASPEERERMLELARVLSRRSR